MATVMAHVPGCACNCDDGPGCTPTLCGNVTACTTGQLPGATVTLTWAGGGATVTTDSAGRFCIPNPCTPTSGDIVITYVISYPGLVSVTGTVTAKCLTGWTFPTPLLFPDADHICLCGCPVPLPRSLSITNSKGSGSLTWSAPSGYYLGTISWTEPEGAASTVAVPNFPFPDCQCAVKGTVNAVVTYQLACSGGTWSLGMYSNFTGSHKTDFDRGDSGDCYGPGASICHGFIGADWRPTARFLNNSVPIMGMRNTTTYGGVPVVCGDGTVNLAFSFPAGAADEYFYWPLETPLSANVTG